MNVYQHYIGQPLTLHSDAIDVDDSRLEGDWVDSHRFLDDDVFYSCLSFHILTLKKERTSDQPRSSLSGRPLEYSRYFC